MAVENIDGPEFYERLIACVDEGKQVGICLIEHPTVEGHVAVFASVIPIKGSKVLLNAAYRGDTHLRACVAIATILRAREAARKLHLTPVPIS